MVNRGSRIAALIAAVSLVACAASARRIAVITRADHGATVAVAPGLPFAVELEGNASTGFEWHVTSIDTSKIARSGAPSYQSSDTLAGSAGIFRLGFMAVGAGRSALRLGYFRSWEHDVAAADSFRVIVDVKKSPR